MAAGYTKQAINIAVRKLCEQRNIVIVDQATKAYRYRVSFKQAQDYTVFALAWQPKNQWFNYKLYHGSIDPERDSKRYQNWY